MEGVTKQSDGSEWPVVAEEERVLYELLFYSQGPVDGYILGEDVRDLFLKSGLSLTVLSQIWNLADVSNDNVLNVHEFALVMHLIRGLLKGLKAPLTLPRKLTPPKTPPVELPPAAPQEKEAYSKIFQALDVNGKGFLEGDCCCPVFQASALTPELLAHVWNLSDVSRDGRLDLEEFCVACHLLRFAKAGNPIAGAVDVFKLLPDRIATKSFQARKRRVQQYEQHKQKLMSLKEKRRQQVLREEKRLYLKQETLDLLKQVFKLQKKLGKPQVTEEVFSANVAKEKEDIEKQEEIVFRLKKEHEAVRQETVKIILAEHKLQSDIAAIKKDTDELNKRLASSHTHATKDPDPFHQLYEQRKEKRQGSTIKDLDKIDVCLPFDFNPFDPSLTSQSLSPGAQLFANSGNNHGSRGSNFQVVIERLGGFGEGFQSCLTDYSASSSCSMEDDSVFKEVPVSVEQHQWLGLKWGTANSEGVFGLTGAETEELQEKLLKLRTELQKLNEPGSCLVFRNPQDYLARKRAKEEEEKSDRSSRWQRRSLTERLSAGFEGSGVSRGLAESGSPSLRHRHSRDGDIFTERSEEISQAVSEYRRQKRHRLSLQSLDTSLPVSANSSASSSPKEVRGSSVKESSSRSRRISSTGSSSEFPAVQNPQQNDAVNSRESEVTGSSNLIERQSTSGSSTVLLESVKRSSGLTQTVSSREVVVKNTEKQSLDGAEQQSNVVKQKVRSTKSADSTRSTNPASDSGSSPLRPSSKKIRAPPPPPASSTPTLSDNSTPAPVDNSTPTSGDFSTAAASPREPPKAVSPKSPAGQQNVTSSNIAAVTAERVSPQARLCVSSPPPQSQLHTSQISSSYILTQPKRGKDSKTARSNSEPNVPGIGLKEAVPKKRQAGLNDQDTEITLRSEKLCLAENTFIEEEAPPAEGTVIVTKSSTSFASSKKDSSPSQPVPGSAKDFEKSSQQESLRQFADGSSSAATISESVKQKHRKGKAPKPPSLSAGKFSEGDLLPSLLPSRISPTDPSPLHSGQSQPNTHWTDKADIKESRKSQFSSVEEQAQSNPISTTRRGPSSQPNSESREGHSGVDVFSAEVAKSIQQIPKAASLEQTTEPSGIILDKPKERDPEVASTTSSLCDSDADGPPPPLPSSAPPPLPSNPPPFQFPSQRLLVEEEVLEVRQVISFAHASPPKKSGKMEEVVLLEVDSSTPDALSDSEDVQKKPSTNLRAEFFGLDSSADSPGIKPSLDLDLNEHGSNMGKDHHEDLITCDSEVSTDSRLCDISCIAYIPFSPGDSGVVMSSLPTSPDDSDSRIHLNFDSSFNKSSNEPSDANLSSSITTPSSESPQTQAMNEHDAVPTEEIPSPLSSISTQEMAALCPRSREIFEKARHFAEMVQKPSFVAKREKMVEGEDEFSPETLQDLEMERRAAISQSTMRRCDVRETMSPPTVQDVDDLSNETVEQAPPAGQSEYIADEEEELVFTPQHAVNPEARWSDKPGRVNLYSENIVQEDQSTDEVDRESIANLATTRKQWETIFTSEPKEESVPKPKHPPKWQVRLPYAEKISVTPATVTSINKDTEPESPPPSTTPNMAEADMESAIEREIRLAMEREQMLKRELEERSRKKSQQGFKASSVESSTESELQPTFHELAEADRGSEFLMNERVAQQDDAEQEEALQRGFAQQKLNSVSKRGPAETESIIEREIRLQREREAELVNLRGEHSAAHSEEKSQHQTQVPSPGSTEEVEEVVVQEIPYEEAISQYSHAGESRIAQELRELKAREDEVRQLRERMSKAKAAEKSSEVSQSKPPANTASSPSDKVPLKPLASPQTPQGNKPTSVSHTDKGPTPSISRSSLNVHASPHLDSTISPSIENPPPKQETPIEREIRLARERENELRRSKGLPELPSEPKNEDTNEKSRGEDFVGTPRYYAQQPDTTIRRFASNRVQQEILDQKNRELKLRQEGKIITTSEEHSQPLRYAEVVGEDKVDGTVKRNFKTPVRRSSAVHQEDLNGDAASPTSRDSPTTKKIPGTGGVSFSYREFAQTAESKIEHELREMREREEELRKQRTGDAES